MPSFGILSAELFQQFLRALMIEGSFALPGFFERLQVSPYLFAGVRLSRVSGALFQFGDKLRSAFRRQYAQDPPMMIAQLDRFSRLVIQLLLIRRQNDLCHDVIPPSAIVSRIAAASSALRCAGAS